MPGGGARLLVLSNCQAFMLESMMQLLTKRHVVSSVTFPELTARYPREEDRQRLYSAFDVVFLQTGSDSVAIPPGVSARVVKFPPVYFYGLHPDLVFVYADDRLVSGPLLDYHSSVAVWGFVNGVSAERVVRLFRRATYDALGFPGMFEESVEHSLGLYAAEGLDMRPYLPGWLRRGAFMYAVNHPRAYVLQDVARVLLAQVDPEEARATAGLEVWDLMPDFLANAPIFPVYPELATRLGIRGDYRFKPQEARRTLSLEEFVAGSYDAYRAAGRERLRCQRLDDPRYARLHDLLQG